MGASIHWLATTLFLAYVKTLPTLYHVVFCNISFIRTNKHSHTTRKNCIFTTKMVEWTAVNAKKAILWKDANLHVLLLCQGVVMPQLTFVFIQSLCTVVIIVCTAVMCMFVHSGSGVILPVHCIRCTLYATFSLKSMHIGALCCMYAKFWSLHRHTYCFKGFRSSCWSSGSCIVGLFSH